MSAKRRVYHGQLYNENGKEKQTKEEEGKKKRKF